MTIRGKKKYKIEHDFFNGLSWWETMTINLIFHGVLFDGHKTEGNIYWNQKFAFNKRNCQGRDMIFNPPLQFQMMILQIAKGNVRRICKGKQTYRRL